MSDTKSITPADMDFTPDTSISTDHFDYRDDSSPPWPDSTFMIRLLPTNEELTLLSGEVILCPAGTVGTLGSIYWECEETKGWLGFRNTASGKMLGNYPGPHLCCVMEHHKGCEYVCVRKAPGEGYVILMSYWGCEETLWSVCVREVEGLRRVVKNEGGIGDAARWEFVKVHE